MENIAFGAVAVICVLVRRGLLAANAKAIRCTLAMHDIRPNRQLSAKSSHNAHFTPPQLPKLLSSWGHKICQMFREQNRKTRNEHRIEVHRHRTYSGLAVYVSRHLLALHSEQYSVSSRDCIWHPHTKQFSSNNSMFVWQRRAHTQKIKSTPTPNSHCLSYSNGFNKNANAHPFLYHAIALIASAAILGRPPNSVRCWLPAAFATTMMHVWNFCFTRTDKIPNTHNSQRPTANNQRGCNWNLTDFHGCEELNYALSKLLCFN